MFLIYVLDFPTYMFDSEHKYAIDYCTLIAPSNACSAPYLSLVEYILCPFINNDNKNGIMIKNTYFQFY